jgi:hypothetical protein
LWRLRGKGLIERVPGTHSYVLTPDGIRAALFYTKTYRTLVDPLFAAAAPDAGPRAGPELRSALRVIDQNLSSGYGPLASGLSKVWRNSTTRALKGP